jgi:arginine/lysine/ornithine decarboxylase
MIHIFYFPEAKLRLLLYRNDISKEDLEFMIEKNFELFKTLKKGEQIRSLADFRGAIAVNSELKKMIADFINEHSHFYSKIYVSGFSAFFTILYKAYLLLSSSKNLYQAVSMPYEDFLMQEGLQVPIELNIKTSIGYIGSSRKE